MIKLKKYILKTSILIMGVGVLTSILSANLNNQEVYAASVNDTQNQENIELEKPIIYQEIGIKPTYNLENRTKTIMTRARTNRTEFTHAQVRNMVYELQWVQGLAGFVAAFTGWIPKIGPVLATSAGAIAFQATVHAASLSRNDLGNGVVIITNLETGHTAIRPRTGYGDGGGGPIPAEIEDDLI